MANETMTLIATTTVGAGGTGGFDFTSIPATYTDLKLVFSIRSDLAVTTRGMYFIINGDFANYTVKRLYGDGSGTYTTSSTNVEFMTAATGASSTSNTFSSGEIYLPNYAGSTNKSWSADIITENNATAAEQNLYAGKWASTSAINRLQLATGNGVWVQYSSASLYGILKGSGGATVS